MASYITLTKYTGSSSNINLPTSIDGIDVKQIGSDVFCSKNMATIRNTDNITRIEDRAFKDNPSATIGSLLSCSYIGSEAFYNFKTTPTFGSACTYIGYRAFDGTEVVNLLLSHYSFAVLTGISATNGFLVAAKSDLTTISSETANNVGFICGHGLYGANITTASFPNCRYIGVIGLCGCNLLESVSFPKCSYIENDAFNSCSSLSTISLPTCNYIGDRTFAYCSNLSSLYLPSTSMCQLGGPEVFVHCSSMVTSGKIYVNDALLSLYRSAQYWSQWAYHIVSPEHPDPPVPTGDGKFKMYDGSSYYTYEFEQGMTWEDFVNSSFNDGAFTVTSTDVLFNKQSQVMVCGNSGSVGKYETILGNMIYANSTTDVMSFNIYDTANGKTLTYYCPQNTTWDSFVNSQYNIDYAMTYVSMGPIHITIGSTQYEIMDAQYSWRPSVYPDATISIYAQYETRV